MEQAIALPYAWWKEAVIVWLIVSVIIYLVVAVPGIYFVMKYRYKPGEREIGDHDFEGHAGLEAVFVIIPTLIVLFLATYSLSIFKKMRTVPDNAMTIKVTAFMWGWQFDYLDEKGNVVKTVVTGYHPNDYNLSEAEKPVIPAGKPIKVLLTSMDVIHSFYVQPARITEDAVPGRITYLWFQINKPGEYYVFCREYCGTGHSHMFSILKVVPPEQFTAWLYGENAVAINQKTNKEVAQ